MAAEIDERIVEAKFDSSQFEKGVNKTIEKLDELKKSLNLKDASKSITEVAEKTADATSKTSDSLDKLSDRLTTFTGMIKNQILSGMAEKVSGVFLSIQNSILGLANTLGSQQIRSGMAKYTETLTAVRMMTLAGQGENKAYDAIEELAAYSDETSYALDQMSDAMSKMVSAGVDLDIAKQSVQGIANACAAAGVNATEAQRAFFNLSQAYSSGSLKYTDYKSLQLLNMTNEQFEKNILAAAEAEGTLKKVKEGVYKTQKSKKNKKVTAGKTVTRQNLTDALKYNIVDTDTMNRLFGQMYYVDVDDFRDAMDKFRGEENQYEKALESLKEKYSDVAIQAFSAAREARSFTDVFNTLKDVISTGWNKSFEYIFGKLEDATEFFTWLTNSNLAQAIYNIGEWRNTLLESWSHESAGTEKGGRDYLFEALKKIDEIIGKITGTISLFVPNAELLGIRLSYLTKKFSESADKASKWLGELDYNKTDGTLIGPKAGSRLESLYKWLQLFSKAFELAGKLVIPIIDGVTSALGKLSAPLDAAFNDSTGVTKLSQTLDNLYTVLSPIANIIGQVLSALGDIGAFFLSMSIDGAISQLEFFADIFGLIIELLGGQSAQKAAGKGVLDDIASQINDFKDACVSALDAVGKFFDALLKDIRTLLGINTSELSDAEQGGLFANIQNFFSTNEFIKNAQAWVSQASTDVQNWIASLPEKIGNLATKVYNAIWGLFYTKETITEPSGATTEILKPTELTLMLRTWWDGIVTSVTEFVSSIPEKVDNFFKEIPNIWNSIMTFLFGKPDNTKEEKVSEDKAAEETNTVIGRIKKFIDGIVSSVKAWFAKLPSFSFKDLVTKIFKFSKKDKKTGKETIEKSGFRTLLDSIFGEEQAEKIESTIIDFAGKIGTFFENLKTSITKIWGNITGIFSGNNVFTNVKNALSNFVQLIASIFTGSTDVEYNITWFREKIVSGIETIKTKLQEVWPRVWEFIQGIPMKIASLFTGTTDYDKNMEIFQTSIANGISGIKKFIEDNHIIETVLEFIGTLPTRIVNLFSGDTKSDVDGGSGKIGSAIQEFGKTVGSFIEGLPSAILVFFNSAVDELDKLWNNFYNALSGNHVEGEELTEEIIEAPIADDAEKQKSKWEEFVETLGSTISNAFSKLPKWIADGLSLAVEGVTFALNKLGSLFYANAEADGVIKNAEEALEPTETPESSALAESFTNLGEKLKELIMTTIPNFIQQGFDYVKSNAPQWLATIGEGIQTVLTDLSKQDGLAGKIGQIGLNIYNFIVDIPNKIQQGWNALKGFFSGEQSFDTEGNAITFDLLQPIKEWFTNIDTGIKELLKNAASEDPGSLKSQIAQIGLTVYTFITETLPQKISEAWTQVKNFFKGNSISTGEGTTYEGLSFTRITTELLEGAKSLGGDFERMGGLVSGFIEKIIPDIQAAWDTLIAWLTGKPLYDVNMRMPAPEVNQTNAKPEIPFPGSVNMVDFLNMDNKLGVPKDKQETVVSNVAPSINDVFERIGQVCKDAFGLIIPYLIQGLTNTITQISQLLQGVSDLITGKKTPEELFADVFGKDAAKNIMESLNSFSATIGNFITTSLPSFIGSTFGLLITEGPKLIERFFGNASTTFTEAVDKGKEDLQKDINDAEQETAQPVEQPKSLLEKVFDWVTSPAFTEGVPDIVRVIGFVIVAKELLSGIKELLDVINPLGNLADHAEEAAEKAKYKFYKALTYAFMGMMLFITYLTTIDDDKFARAKEVLGMFIDLAKWLIVVVGLIKTIQGGADVLEQINQLKGVTDEPENQDADTTDGALDAITERVTSQIEERADEVASSIGDNVNSVLGDASGGLKILGTGSAVVAVVAEAEGLLNTTIQDFLARFEDIGTAFTGFSQRMANAAEYINKAKDTINTAIQVIGKGIELCVKIKEMSDYYSDVKTVNSMMYGLGTSMGYFTMMTSNSEGSKQAADAVVELLGMTTEMSTFVEFIEKDNTFDKFKYALASLGAALSFNPSGNVIKDSSAIGYAIEFLKKIVGDQGLMSLAAKFSPENMGISPDDMWTTTEQLLIFAGAIAKLGTAVMDIQSGMGDKISTFFDEVSKIKINEIDTTDATDEQIGNIGARMNALGKSLGSFAEGANTLDDSKVRIAEYALDMVLHVAEQFYKIDSGIWSWLIGGADVTKFAEGIDALGQHISHFMNWLTYGKDVPEVDDQQIQYSMDNIRAALNVINTVLTATDAFGSVIKKMTEANQSVNANSLAADSNDFFSFFELFLGKDGAMGVLLSNFLIAFATNVQTINGKDYSISDLPFSEILDGIYSFYEVMRCLDLLTDAMSSLSSFSKPVIDAGKGYGLNDALNQLSYALFGTGDIEISLSNGQTIKPHKDSLLGILINFIRALGRSDFISDQEVTKARKALGVLTEFTEIIATLYYQSVSVIKGTDFGTKGKDNIASGSLRQTVANTEYTLVPVKNSIVSAKDAIASLVDSMQIFIDKKDKIRNFLDISRDLVDDYDFTNATKLFDLLQIVGRAFVYFGTTNSQGLEAARRGINSLGDLDTETIVTGVSHIFEALNTVLIDPKNKARLEASTNTLGTFFRESLQKAFDNPSSPDEQLKIKPVLNMDTIHEQLKDDQTLSVLANLGGLNVNVPPDLLASINNIPNYTMQLTAISTQIDTLNTSIRSMNEDLTSMKIYLNGSALVGGLMPDIKANIARDYFLQSRGILPK